MNETEEFWFDISDFIGRTKGEKIGLVGNMKIYTDNDSDGDYSDSVVWYNSTTVSLGNISGNGGILSVKMEIIEIREASVDEYVTTFGVYGG